MTAPKPSRPTRREIERWVYAIVDRVFAQLEAGALIVDPKVALVVDRLFAESAAKTLSIDPKIVARLERSAWRAS